MTTLRRPLPLTAGTAVLALLLGACGGDDDPTAARIDDADVAAELADTADQLAAHLDGGEDCAALDEAELLYARTREGTEAGSVPPEVAREIEDVATELTRALNCDEEDVAEPEPEPEPTEEATSGGSSSGGSSGGSSSGGGKGNNNGNQGKGKGK